MKLIIAGSRELGNRLESTFVEDLIMEFGIGKPEEVVSGGAHGIDNLGESYASMARVEVSRFPADWDKYGKAAGPKRNRIMASYADALLLIWDGESRGSANMRESMLNLDKPVYEVILRRLR